MTTKTVLITGSTRGIGLTLAEHYIKAGWNVIGTARNINAADKLQALSPSKIIQLDSADEDSILNAAKALEGVPIDLLINNAGILEKGDLAATTKASLLRQFEVNTVGPFLVTRAFIPNLKLAAAKNGSAIVAHVGSYMGSITLNAGPIADMLGRQYGYRASKTALNMINACLAQDVKKDNIIAISIHPGYVVTELNGNNGQIQPSESVAGMTKVLASITIEDTNKFYQYDGTILPW